MGQFRQCTPERPGEASEHDEDGKQRGERPRRRGGSRRSHGILSMVRRTGSDEPPGAGWSSRAATESAGFAKGGKKVAAIGIPCQTAATNPPLRLIPESIHEHMSMPRSDPLRDDSWRKGSVLLVDTESQDRFVRVQVGRGKKMGAPARPWPS